MDFKKLCKPLHINDLDFRIQSINKGGYATILVYKDARADMNRLDEVVSPVKWKREHTMIDGINYCTVSIYSDNIKEWISKQDCGVESMTEKEKGQASDAFKRACFNLGIGRELYDYPVIQVKLNPDEFKVVGDKAKQTYNLKLKEWKWAKQMLGHKVFYLAAKDEKGKVRFSYGQHTPKLPLETTASVQDLIKELDLKTIKGPEVYPNKTGYQGD